MNEYSPYLIILIQIEVPYVHHIRKIVRVIYVQKYGEWVVVTGASSGIGREFAKQLSAQGKRIVLVARTEGDLIQTADNLTNTSNKIIVADLSKPEGRQTLIDQTETLDVGLFVHAGGTVHAGRFLDTSDPKNEVMLGIHLDATVSLSKHFGRRFFDRKGGGIVLISSGFAFAPVPYLAVYAAAKAFMLHFGEALAEELRSENIDVLTVLPGGTNTQMAEKLGEMIDFSKLAMPMGDPAKVASESLRALGYADSVIPGLKNKVMGFMMGRLLARGTAKRMLGKMISGALREGVS